MKFDIVHRNTVKRRQPMPIVRLATPPRPTLDLHVEKVLLFDLVRRIESMLSLASASSDKAVEYLRRCASPDAIVSAAARSGSWTVIYIHDRSQVDGSYGSGMLLPCLPPQTEISTAWLIGAVCVRAARRAQSPRRHVPAATLSALGIADRKSAPDVGKPRLSADAFGGCWSSGFGTVG